ncbi:MAG: hypothetical protein HQM16_15985 [Deltaproteobacteria bacterium]|nr:hypothetical protein [Deltaproteobacteria bacterium]
MSVSLSHAVLRDIATVDDDAWGPLGYLNEGDYLVVDGRSQRVNSWDLSSYQALDSFLEQATGSKIDFIEHSGSWGGSSAAYMVYRSRSRGMGVMHMARERNMLPLRPESYRRPDYDAYQLQYSARLMLCILDPSCAGVISSDYYNLQASAAEYTRAYNDYNNAYRKYADTQRYSALTRQNIADLVAKSNLYLNAKYNFELYESRFYTRDPYIPDYHIPRTPGGGSPDSDWDSDWGDDWDTQPPRRTPPRRLPPDRDTRPPRRTPPPRTPGGGDPGDDWDTQPPRRTPPDSDDGWN